MVIMSYNIVHALLYLVYVLPRCGGCVFVLALPLWQRLEVIVYAGAIVVLIIFVIMMLSLKRNRRNGETMADTQKWIGPAILSILLIGELDLRYCDGGVTRPEITHGRFKSGRFFTLYNLCDRRWSCVEFADGRIVGGPITRTAEEENYTSVSWKWPKD